MLSHSGIAGFTPSQVFTGEYKTIALTKQAALDQAYEKHPERFSQGTPLIALPPSDVYINPVPADADKAIIEKEVNFPTHQRVIEKQFN